MPEDSVFRFLPYVERIFGAPTVEEILRALDDEIATSPASEPEVVKFLEGLKESMLAASPLMLKVTLRRLQTTGSMRLSDVLQQDFAMVQHSLNDPNFFEGVRARLIDKDGAPKWAPMTVEEVTPAMVDAFFQPAPDNLPLTKELLKYEEDVLSWRRARALERVKAEESQERHTRRKALMTAEEEENTYDHTQEDQDQQHVPTHRSKL